MDLAGNLVTFIIGIGILIVVHELGHFLAARLLNIEVEEFGIGFGPRLFTFFRHKGTRFTLNLLPLGGFVLPKGENDPSVPGGLAAASPWVRLGVISAGPVMNLVMALVLATMFFYSIGEPAGKVLIKEIAPGSPAEAAALLPGDIILKADGADIHTVVELQRIVAARRGQTLTLLIQRGEQTLQVSLIPRLNPPEGQGPLGVVLDEPTRPTTLIAAAQRSTEFAGEYLRQLLNLGGRLVVGQVTPEEGRVVGYKGMFDIYQRVQNPLWFFAIISFSLGLLNLLPFPALDGGRILFLIPEILFKRRLPHRLENLVNMIGLALLLLLLLYVNIQDFLNPITLP